MESRALYLHDSLIETAQMDTLSIVLQFGGDLPELIGGLSLLEVIAAVAGISAVIGGVVTFLVRRFLLGPELLIDVSLRGFHVRADHVKASMTLYIVNAGNRPADDVEISFTADAFSFENDMPTSDTPTESYDPPQTELVIDRGAKHDFVGGGRRHDLVLARPLTRENSYELYLGEAVFKNEGEHELKYSITCRQKGTKEGSIVFKIDGENSRVVARKYPKWTRRLRATLGWEPPRTRIDTVENLPER